ncbi:MAG: aminomethyl-transferring glycine dehydrogenase subunit GcvPB [Candidatus Hydrogenedentota bacterium]
MTDHSSLIPEYRTELEVVRRFTRLSRLNFSVDAEFYPLGSCTMKYNPKVCDAAVSLAGLRDLHPSELDGSSPQAECLRRILSELNAYLSLLCGMEAFALSPAAGAHGEFAGCLIIRKYHLDNKQTDRTEMLIPDSAHGTNPASAKGSGFEVVTVRTGPDGCVDLDDLRSKAGSRTAGMMMTNPNTLGLFERRVEDVTSIVHAAGGLMYYDGANLNAIVGLASPGSMGFDVCHVNLHKTFAVPHGGGGPGAGPVGVTKKLAEYLPAPVYSRGKNTTPSKSIGRMMAFGGNIGALVRAHTYIVAMGLAGLRRAAKDAVISANYIRCALKDLYPSPYSEMPCAHECLLSASKLKAERGITANLVAKGLIERGIHPPTVYFPLLVPEALLIEPTETESLETLDEFIRAMREIAALDGERLSLLPTNSPIRKPDEAAAARNPVLKA